jgi:hypothetical protein
VPIRTELRRLVEQWKESGPNLKKLFAKHEELECRTMHGRATLWPTGSGAGYLLWDPVPENLDLNGSGQRNGRHVQWMFRYDCGEVWITRNYRCYRRMLQSRAVVFPVSRLRALSLHNAPWFCWNYRELEANVEIRFGW